MKELNNLDQLADKIYQEGIEKAQQESSAMLARATADRDRILEAAREEAKKIIADAHREATQIAQSTEQELLRKGKQLISDLKVEIHRMLSDKILKGNTQAALADVEFLQEAIREAIASWDATDGLELVLPPELEHKLGEAFRQSIHEYAKNLTVTFSGRLSGGFRIVEKDQAYQISFTESDFIALFTPYLEEQTSQKLFSTST